MIVYNPAQQPARRGTLAAYWKNTTLVASTGMVVRIGDYVVGDEHCHWLYGPTDVRY